MDLDDDLRALYALTLRMPGARPEEIALALGDADAGRVVDDLHRLAELGLVRQVDDGITATPPAIGLSRLLSEDLDETIRRLTAAQRLIGEWEPLSRDAAGSGVGPSDADVRLVSGLTEAWEVPLRLALRNPPVRSLCCQPDPRPFDAQVLPWLDDMLALTSAGTVLMSLLADPAVLDSPGAAATLQRFADAGVEVRVRANLPSGYYVMGEYAAVPLRWGDDLADSAYRFHLVRSPVLVAALTSLFAELWRSAVPLRAPADPYRQVVVLLAEGLTDEAIARRLGVSVRTVRARLARAMADLGVRTRFQAGALAARLGWLD